jgi:hypothetical protein
MSGDYLWDKSGEPDPEIQRLENLLAPLGHQEGRVPAWPAPRSRRIPVLLAIAASVLVAVAGTWIAVQRNRPAWQVKMVQGAPSITKLGNGQSLVTDGQSRARLDLDGVGEVQVEPNSRVSVVAMKSDEQRLSLEHGEIHALIWAPPGKFYVNTPSSQTVDLGCEYRLQVDAEGVGLVHVNTGWVAFEKDGRESFIPEGAACVTRPNKGPGIPYYEDATKLLIDAVHRFDADGDQPAIGVITTEARKKDAISLWHLLRRVPPSDRTRVYDRLSEFITIPASVTREGILGGNPAMIDGLWNELDIGDTSWWRMWKSRMR